MMLFNAAALDLFPELLSEIRKATLERVNELYEELQGDPSKTTRLKLDFLEQLLKRAEAKRIETEV